jgi:hypothetical protein
MPLTRIKPQGLDSFGVQYLSTPTWTTGVNTYNLQNGNIFYHTTTPTASWTADFTNVPTTYTVNQAATPAYGGLMVEVKIVATLGASAYYPNAVRIDGSAQTLVAQGTTATINKFNIWTYQLYRVGSTWTKVVLKTVEAF